MNGQLDDTPLSDPSADRIGFGDVAKHLAQAFLENDLDRGFVIGVEGAWGSGKSSLINLSLQQFEEPQAEAVVVRFSPWLVGSRDEMLRQYFAELARATEKLLPNETGNATRAALKRYAGAASGLAGLVGYAGMLGLPAADLIKKGLGDAAGVLTGLADTSLTDLNAELRHALASLPKPIIVFIDDLDRLEPAEAVEVLRLVRAVADFPKIGYILAYDPDILAKSLALTNGIEDGRAYLEKIVQVSFRVPTAQAFDLRNWLYTSFETLVGPDGMTEAQRHRVQTVLLGWGQRYVSTPRDVVRVVNALRFHYIPVRDAVDPADMLFLQIVRTRNDSFLRWIEHYVTALSAMADGNFATEGDRVEAGRALLQIATESGERDHVRFLHRLADHLPGLDVLSLVKNGEAFKVGTGWSNDDMRRRYAADRRLASPRHYSLYFAFSRPVGHLHDDDLQNFLSEAIAAPDAAIERFRSWARTPRPQGRMMGEAVLDRLMEHLPSSSPDEAHALLHVFGGSMDKLACHCDPDSGYPDFLRGERGRPFEYVTRLQEDSRSEVLNDLFDTASSLAWLSGIVRSHIGRIDPQTRKVQIEQDALLTQAEFEVVRAAFVDRCAKAEPETLLDTPYFLSLMYGWHQAGDVQRCLAWVRTQTSNDGDLVRVLQRMTSWSNSSDVGIRHTVRRRTLEDFFADADAVIESLNRIAAEGDQDVRDTAKAILDGYSKDD